MTLKQLSEEIRLIKDNHLKHMAEDIDKVEKKIEKMDARVWAILILLLGATVVPAFINFIKSNT